MFSMICIAGGTNLAAVIWMLPLFSSIPVALVRDFQCTDGTDTRTRRRRQWPHQIRRGCRDVLATVESASGPAQR